MKTLKILGTGCMKCEKLYHLTEETAQAMGLDFTIEKVQDINAIIGYGVMMTPALVIDENVVLSGQVPSAERLRELLSA